MGVANLVSITEIGNDQPIYFRHLRLEICDVLGWVSIFGMEIFHISAVLLTIAAVFGYLNYRYIHLPTTIGIMLISLAVSLVLICLGIFFPDSVEVARELVGEIDFNKTLLECMLSFLLFAGALHVNISDLAQQKRVIGFLASVGVVLSTFLVGTIFFFIFSLLGVHVAWIHCLLFGALISPTDPVAVLGILKKAKVPKSLETKITGESLFNDGVGVVVFLVILGIATGQLELSVVEVGKHFFLEAGGGIVLGLLLGWTSYALLKRVDQYQVEVLITLALVMGGYSLALMLHVSGPLAMVVAGLMIGNQGRAFAMSSSTREHLDTFWELVDEVLNAILFLLIGLELLILNVRLDFLLYGLVAIVVVLGARFFSVSVAVVSLKKFRTFSPGVIKMLTWGGLRGGISVALALALPREVLGETRDLFIFATYCVVIFSVAVQGLTLKRLFV